jgi:hypothetical protein
MSNGFECDDQHDFGGRDFDPLKNCSIDYEQLLNDLLSRYGLDSIPHVKNLPNEEFFKEWDMKMDDMDDIEENSVHRLYEIGLAGIKNIRIGNLFNRTDVQTVRFRIRRFINADMG